MAFTSVDSRREEMSREASRILESVLPPDHFGSATVLDSCGLNITRGCEDAATNNVFAQSDTTPDTLLNDSENSVLLMRGTIYNLRTLLRRARRFPHPITSKWETGNEMRDLFDIEWGASDEIILPILREMEGMFALMMQSNGEVFLARDPLGMKSLYIGNRQGKLVAGFDLKVVAEAADEVAEFPPGFFYSSQGGLRPFYRLSRGVPDVSHAHTASREMLALLTHSVRASLPTSGPNVSTGILLSGGVASSVLASVASRFRPYLYSVTVGVTGASDLIAARQVAAALEMTHYEHIVTPEQIIDALPEIIFNLETFRCGTVRRALAYHFAARAAREAGISVVLSGDGANALFAGDPTQTGGGGDGGRLANPGEAYQLHQEVLLQTSLLYCTNLRGADRMGYAHGLDVRLPYLDAPSLVDLALRITPDLKVGMIDEKKLIGTGVPRRTRFGKRVLREVAMELLPATVASEVALRPRMRFEQGAGFKRLLMQHAANEISDDEFFANRELSHGVRLCNKEEMLYYRIFSDLFPAERLLKLVMGISDPSD